MALVLLLIVLVAFLVGGVAAVSEASYSFHLWFATGLPKSLIFLPSTTFQPPCVPNRCTETPVQQDCTPQDIKTFN